MAVKPRAPAPPVACRLALAGSALIAPLLATAQFEDRAGDATIRLDSERSHVEFTVRMMWLVPISGRFGKVEGTVRLDGFRSEVSVDARIDANTVNMSHKSYEDWVKSPEFFDVERYPHIEFSSEPFPRVRLRKGGALPGFVTIRGIRQPVTFRLMPSSCDKPADACPIEVEGTIRRSEFGMRSRRGTLSDKVELEFDVYAVPAAGAPGR